MYISSNRSYYPKTQWKNRNLTKNPNLYPHVCMFVIFANLYCKHSQINLKVIMAVHIHLLYMTTSITYKFKNVWLISHQGITLCKKSARWVDCFLQIIRVLN